MLFTDDEEATAETFMPSVGRGMQLPPICDVVFPKAYYDELPVHMHSLSGIGRGRQLQELVGVNINLEVPGQRAHVVPEIQECSNFELPDSLDEFPELDGGHAEKDVVISEEKSVNQQEQPKSSLKSIAAQFATTK